MKRKATKSEMAADTVTLLAALVTLGAFRDRTDKALAKRLARKGIVLARP